MCELLWTDPSFLDTVDEGETFDCEVDTDVYDICGDEGDFTRFLLAADDLAQGYAS